MADNQAGARIVESLIAKYGCLPSVGDGPVIERFDAAALAAALESEIARAADYGWTKVTLHMDIPDARALAKCLREKAN